MTEDPTGGRTAGTARPLSKAAQRRYRAARAAYGTYGVQLELDVDTLAVLVGVLQLGLRQPACPAGSRGFLERWLEATLTALGRLALALAAGLRAENDPAHDG